MAIYSSSSPLGRGPRQTASGVGDAEECESDPVVSTNHARMEHRGVLIGWLPTASAPAAKRNRKGSVHVKEEKEE